MDGIHQQLRVATDSLHRRLEQQLDLLNPARTLEDYRRLMARLFGFYRALEARLASASEGRAWQAEVLSRLKTPALRRDLKQLGLADAEIDLLPAPALLPAVVELPEVLGVMYVLEGSTLGGVLLARHFRQTLTVGPSSGAGFWDFYGERLRDNWTSFLQWLEQAAASADRQAIISAAEETFHAYGAWIGAKSLDG